MSTVLSAVWRSPVTWGVLIAAAVLWPSRFLGPFDGVPLDAPLEAIGLGLVLPWAFWLGRDACRTKAFRIAVLALLTWKAGTAAVAVQQGLCAQFRAPQPLHGDAITFAIEEPLGYLRSWDLRADLWDFEPKCTAVLSRPLPDTEAFPAWFVNITDVMMRRRDFTMTVRGFVTNDGQTQPVEYSLALKRDPWVFDPTVNGASVWSAPLVTTAPPSAIDRALAPWAWTVAPVLCLAILAMLLRSAATVLREPRSVAWVLASAVMGVALAQLPDSAHRAAGVIALGALVARVPAASGNLRLAAWMLGASWLSFFAASSVDLVGRLTPYSVDDWLAYQIAGYRIYMNGHWLEGGTAAFDYQMLYRWITGALHLVFGDASVGETYWDASSLLIGALLAFYLAHRHAGFQWGLAAGALVLATMTLSTGWHFFGRGLSEISAAGFAFLAAAALLRARDRGAAWALVAAVMAALMFYARQNHLLWAPCFVALLLPPETGSDFASIRVAMARVPWRAAVAYLGGFAVAVVALMTRTYYFTGQFSLFYGTSMHKNDIGLRPWTILDLEVWSNVVHSLAAVIFMNEPPRPDVRSVVLAIGAVVAILALLPVPLARRIPAALVIVAITGVGSAFIVHSHAYPGRFSIHLLPFAAALTAIAASTMTRGFTGSDWRVSQSSGR